MNMALTPENKEAAASLGPAQLFVLFRRNLSFLALCVGIGFLFGVLFLHLAAYQYTVEMEVSPVRSQQGGGAASRLGNLGGLAAAAGISLPKSEADEGFSLYLEGIYTQSVSNALSRNPEIMHKVFPGAWDTVNSRWKQPNPLKKALVDNLKYVLGIPVRPWSPPTGADLLAYIKKNVVVDRSPQQVLVTITFRHRDPIFARKFLLALNSAVDQELRQKAMRRSQLYVDYLSKKLPTVTVSEYREALVSALSQQEQSLMMASADAPFAAAPFGEPTAPLAPSSPKPTLLLSLGMFLGLILAAFIITMGYIQGMTPIEYIASLTPFGRKRD